MAKKAWWDPTGWFGGGDEEESSIQSTTVTNDPARKAVSDSLSSYITSNLGKGATAYTGDLTTSYDTDAMNRYSEFMSMDPTSWFKSAVTDPTIKEFTKTTLPEINESWAGYQSGSGRGYDQTTAMTDVAEALGTAGAKQIPSIYSTQLSMANQKATLDQANKKALYTEWLRTQPEYSPVLEQAINYLGGSSGTQTYSYWGDTNDTSTIDWASMATDVAAIIAAFI